MCKYIEVFILHKNKASDNIDIHVHLYKQNSASRITPNGSPPKFSARYKGAEFFVRKPSTSQPVSPTPTEVRLLKFLGFQDFMRGFHRGELKSFFNIVFMY